MNCSEIQAFLVDLLYDELAAEMRSRLLAHLEGCSECGERWNRLRALSAAADQWTAPPLPRGLAERALARVASERVREASREWRGLAPNQILQGVLLGAGAALVSLLLIVGVSDRQLAPLSVGVVGVVWTALYAGLLLTASYARVRPVAWSALSGAGVALILASPLSIPSVVEACARLLQAAPGSVLFSLLLLVFAAGYTAGPLLVGGFAFGRPRPGSRLKDGATLSLLYVLLIAPAVYLQCLQLPLNVTAVWMAGTIAGAWLGGQASLRLAEWRARSA
jgi:anti-sigma factor RsiW